MSYWKTGKDVYIGDPFGEAVELNQEEFEILSLENAIRTERARRDSLLLAVVDAMNPMRWELLSDVEKQAWRDYRQALLDVPQQPGFPKEIDWPVAPERTGGENE
ncbi:tail fiber assembly protein [uncultured Sphaerochaeta sp.]|jgi:hypothetical protein|uniref:tail fiber assembly protein n=1 Tax=uncultured Sphaerochaeta sp. TaxID=886478 RepID=UPI002AA6E428|nr:tail fiber assembly protein [uncultured Sphaerochaeta sp.]